MNLDRLLSLVCSFFIVTATLRYLTISEFGTLTIIITFFSAFSPLLNMGTAVYAVKHFKASQNTLISMFLLHFAHSIMLVVLLYIVSNLIGTQLSYEYYFIIILYSLSSIRAWYEAQQKFLLISGVSIVWTLISNGLKLGIIINDAGLQYLIYVSIIDQIAVNFLLTCTYLTLHMEKQLIIGITSLRKIYKELSIITYNSMISSLSSKSEIPLMSLIGVNPIVIGIYSGIVRLLNPMLNLIPLIFNYLYPKLIDEKAKGYVHFKTELLNQYALALKIGIVASIITSIFYVLIGYTKFIPKDYPTITAAAILPISLFATSIAQPFSKYLITMNRTKFMFSILLSTILLKYAALLSAAFLGYTSMMFLAYSMSTFAPYFFKKRIMKIQRLMIISATKDLCK